MRFGARQSSCCCRVWPRYPQSPVAPRPGQEPSADVPCHRRIASPSRRRFAIKKGRPVTNLRPDDFQLFDSGVSRADRRLPRRADAGQRGDARRLQRQHGRRVARAAHARSRASPAGWLTPGKDRSASVAFDHDAARAAAVRARRRATCSRSSTAPAVRQDVAVRRDRRNRPRARRRRRSAPRGRRAHRRRRQREPADAGAGVGHRERHRRAGLHHPRHLAARSRGQRPSIDEDRRCDALQAGRLGDLARWTGGEIFAAVGPADHEPGRPANRHGASSSVLDRVRAEHASLAGIRSTFARETRISSCAREADTSCRASRHTVT